MPDCQGISHMKRKKSKPDLRKRRSRSLFLALVVSLFLLLWFWRGRSRIDRRRASWLIGDDWCCSWTVLALCPVTLKKSSFFTSNCWRLLFLTFSYCIAEKLKGSFDSDSQNGDFMEVFYWFVRFEFSLLIFCSVCCMFRLITYWSPPILGLGHACWWKKWLECVQLQQ